MRRARSSTPPTRRNSSWVLDENEEVIVDFPDEDSQELLKRYQGDQDVFQITGFIKKGAINCAHYVQNKSGQTHVLRVSYLPNWNVFDQINRRVLRGLQVLHLFQSYRGLLGPSLLEETSTFRVFAETEENRNFAGDICSDIRDTQEEMVQRKIKGNRFALQHMEWLRGGVYEAATIEHEQFNKKERMFAIFSLIWFLSMAQQAWDFGHHDLKAENIVFRKTEEPRDYNFALDDRSYFHFRSRFVPVIIDYDFATLNVTENALDRIEPGTPYSSSPDSLLYKICLINGAEYNVAYYRHAHDWWSLGICILELYVKNVHAAFEEQCIRFANVMMKYPPFAFEKKQIKRTYLNLTAFYYSCCIAAVFAEGNEEGIVQPPSEYYPYTEALFGDGKLITEAVTNSNDYKVLMEWKRDPDNSPIVSMLSRLLHWNPTARNYNNRGFAHLARFTKHHGSHTPQLPLEAYEFKGSMKVEERQEWDTQTYPLLKSELCASCARVEGTYLCPCCNEVYCGADCQKSTH